VIKFCLFNPDKFQATVCANTGRISLPGRSVHSLNTLALTSACDVLWQCACIPEKPLQTRCTNALCIQCVCCGSRTRPSSFLVSMSADLPTRTVQRKILGTYLCAWHDCMRVHKCVHGMACTHLPVFTLAHTHSAQIMATTRPSVYISFPLRIKYPVSRHTCIRMYIHANKHHSHTHLRKNVLAHVDTHHTSVPYLPPSF